MSDLFFRTVNEEFKNGWKIFAYNSVKECTSSFRVKGKQVLECKREVKNSLNNRVITNNGIFRVTLLSPDFERM